MKPSEDARRRRRGRFRKCAPGSCAGVLDETENLERDHRQDARHEIEDETANEDRKGRQLQQIQLGALRRVCWRFVAAVAAVTAATLCCLTKRHDHPKRSIPSRDCTLGVRRRHSGMTKTIEPSLPTVPGARWPINGRGIRQREKINRGLAGRGSCLRSLGGNSFASTTPVQDALPRTRRAAAVGRRSRNFVKSSALAEVLCAPTGRSNCTLALPEMQIFSQTSQFASPASLTDVASILDGGVICIMSRTSS